MRYSVPVELSDLVDTLMNVHSQEEVMNAFLAIDQGQADLDFSIRLIERLVKSVGEEIQTDEFACLESSIIVKMDLPVPGLPDGSVTVPTAVKVEALVEALALQPPAWLITLMHTALEIREEAAREKSAKLAKLACSCGHNAGVHNTKGGVCSSEQKRREDCHGCAIGFSGTPCEECGAQKEEHPAKPYTCDKWKSPQCASCGCLRSRHVVNVGGEARGCFDHFNCDGFKSEGSVLGASIT